MSLAGLVESDLEGYIAQNRGNDRCWFFIHIPKTAGSSFRRELAQILRPNYNVHVDRNPVSAAPIPHARKIAAVTKEFSALLGERTYRFASGHVPVTQLKANVDTWRDLKLITMLRDPASRAVSDYRYQTTPAHPTHRQFLERFPTFEKYLEAPHLRNRMFKFLRPSQEATVEDCIEFIVEHFAFVGLVEMYPLSVRLLTRLMEHERSPTLYIRKTEDNEHNRLEVTPELLDRVRELNSLDVALYDYFHDRLSRVDDQVFVNGVASRNCSPQSTAVRSHPTEADVPDATLYHRVIDEARILTFQTPVVAQPPLGFRGGVVLGDSEEDRRLRHTRGGRPVDSLDASAIVKDRLNGRYAYGGFVYHHFGHVMAETVHRILPSRRHEPDRSFIFVNSRHWNSFEHLPAHVQQIYLFLGLQPETIKIISSNHIVESLLVSEAGSDLGGGPKEPYLNLLDTYTGPKLDRMFGSTPRGKKIYVSRSKLTINGGTLCGETYIENALAAEGYEIFHPQDHPFAVQMDTYRKAELVIFLEGSSCHGAELLGHDAINNCILLNRRGLSKFDKMLGPRVRNYSTFGLNYAGSIYAARDGRGLAGRGVSMAQWDSLVEFFRNIGAARLSSTSKEAYLAAAERDFRRYLEGAERCRSRQVSDVLATQLMQRFEALKAS